MTTNQESNDRNDMLTPSSTPQEMLRTLYFYGVDYIILMLNRNERLLHKDQLIALLEQDREGSTVEELVSVAPSDQMPARVQIEDIPQSTPLLIYSQAKGDGGPPRYELTKITFREYRERKIRENTIVLPDWWSIPLPILHMNDEAIFLNDRALELVPGGARSLASQMDRIREDRIITLKEEDRDRTFSLFALTEDSYLLEDISGDFEMAEDLVWWAAIGRALMRRIEDNGLIVKRLSPYEKPPEGIAEVIQCSWEGEVMGRLAIVLPPDEPQAESESGDRGDGTGEPEEMGSLGDHRGLGSPDDASGPRPEAVREEVPAPKDGSSPGEKPSPDEAKPEPTQGRAADTIKKNAARTAYGAKPPKPVKSEKTAAPAGAAAGEPETGGKKSADASEGSIPAGEAPALPRGRTGPVSRRRAEKKRPGDERGKGN
ncbi:MAG: hypothetical protein LBQ56_08125 [Synergistaceae bacterium]|jgi:hypothetical protein|nr:hypothetical protein [Synergistaceae bacterium]